MARRMIERYRRGPIGWLMRILFWGFNALMAFALIVGIAGNAERATQITDASTRAGYWAGTWLGVAILLIVWAAGAIILGLLSHFTRGRKEILDVEG